MSRSSAPTLRSFPLGRQIRAYDDEVFRFGLAYLWLRLAEPTCQLVIQPGRPIVEADVAAHR
jgi:hypothetical protein